MTPPITPDDVTSPEDFERYISATIYAAYVNGVDPRGVWEYRAQNGEADFEIEVVELDGGRGDD